LHQIQQSTEWLAVAFAHCGRLEKLELRSVTTW
jgi:hypothetical protein